jgi:hypothetical protein
MFNFELLSRRAMVFTLAENVVDVCRESDKTQQILVEYRRTDSGALPLACTCRERALT